MAQNEHHKLIILLSGKLEKADILQSGASQSESEPPVSTGLQSTGKNDRTTQFALLLNPLKMKVHLASSDSEPFVFYIILCKNYNVDAPAKL